eukprot:UN05510
MVIITYSTFEYVQYVLIETKPFSKKSIFATHIKIQLFTNPFLRSTG